jgi:Mg2+ and Co2+ transporter CorA
VEHYIAVGHNLLDEVVLLIQCHMADVMMKVTVSTDVTSLATVVAGLH